MGKYDKEKQFVMDALSDVGRLHMGKFGTFVPPMYKGTRTDPNAIGNSQARTTYTAVDCESQELVLNKLYREFRTDDIIPEEFTVSVRLFASNAGSHRKWVIDPLDGSYLYLQRKPSFGAVIGLVVDDEFVLGAMHQSKDDILYLAVEGEGLKKFTKQAPGGIEVKLADPSPPKPGIGDRILLGGGVPQRVPPVLNEQAGGVTFTHDQNLCSLDRTRMVLEGSAKAYLRHQSTIFGAGPQAFMIEQAGGVVVDLDNNPPEWVSRQDGFAKTAMLKSYAVYGPKEYGLALASLINNILKTYKIA